MCLLRVAEEPLLRAIKNTSVSLNRGHAVKLLQRWFCISLRNNIAVKRLSQRALEGVMLDTQMDEMSVSEAQMWADDNAVLKWIVQFISEGPEGNIFQREVDVSLVTDSACKYADAEHSEQMLCAAKLRHCR